jgi:hypothetical protein
VVGCLVDCHNIAPRPVGQDAPVILPPRVARALTGIGLVLALSGCAINGLSFRIDDRLQILRPADREAVSLPLTIEWDISDFEVTGPDGSDDPHRGYFGVFVDRAPQPPNETVEWFAKDDESCRPADGCPDEQYLADRGVHTTTDTEFVIETLPPPPTDQADRRELHEVTIVLLDGSGRRIGESAFTAEFEVQR